MNDRAELARLHAERDELLDCLGLLLGQIGVNGDDVGIVSDRHTIQVIRRARIAIVKATGEREP